MNNHIRLCYRRNNIINPDQLVDLIHFAELGNEDAITIIGDLFRMFSITANKSTKLFWLCTHYDFINWRRLYNELGPDSSMNFETKRTITELLCDRGFLPAVLDRGLYLRELANASLGASRTKLTEAANRVIFSAAEAGQITAIQFLIDDYTSSREKNKNGSIIVLQALKCRAIEFHALCQLLRQRINQQKKAVLYSLLNTKHKVS